MREIKFRFWVDGANGEFMIYPDNRENSNFNSEGWGFYLDDEGFEIINHRGVVEPAHHVPMQYTGLKDKNGVEIYEGDVVNITQYFGGHPYGETKHIIKRSEYNNNLVADSESGDWRTPEVSMSFRNSDDYEVIGNIYENSELLEAEE